MWAGQAHQFPRTGGHDRPGGGRRSLEFAPLHQRESPGAGGLLFRHIQDPGMVGWEPQVSLEEGLRRTIEYYRQHKAYYW